MMLIKRLLVAGMLAFSIGFGMAACQNEAEEETAGQGTLMEEENIGQGRLMEEERGYFENQNGAE